MLIKYVLTPAIFLSGILRQAEEKTTIASLKLPDTSINKKTLIHIVKSDSNEKTFTESTHVWAHFST